VAAARDIGSTWRDEGQPARATWAAGGRAARRVERGAVGRRAAGARGRPAAGSRARGRETGELGDSRRKTEDRVVKSRKLRGLTIKHG
jgi:hypothetical protein